MSQVNSIQIDSSIQGHRFVHSIQSENMNIDTTIKILLLGLLTISCSADDDQLTQQMLCEIEEDYNSPQIIDAYVLNCNFQLDSTYIISNQVDWRNTLSSCFRQDIPQIDFQKHDVIGITVGASGCQRFYERIFTMDADAMTASYLLTYFECGLCEPYVLTTQWIVVDKIPSNYEILITSQKG